MNFMVCMFALVAVSSAGLLPEDGYNYEPPKIRLDETQTQLPSFVPMVQYAPVQTVVQKTMDHQGKRAMGILDLPYASDSFTSNPDDQTQSLPVQPVVLATQDQQNSKVFMGISKNVILPLSLPLSGYSTDDQTQTQLSTPFIPQPPQTVYRDHPVPQVVLVTQDQQKSKVFKGANNINRELPSAFAEPQTPLAPSADYPKPITLDYPTQTTVKQTIDYQRTTNANSIDNQLPSAYYPGGGYSPDAQTQLVEPQPPLDQTQTQLSTPFIPQQPQTFQKPAPAPVYQLVRATQDQQNSKVFMGANGINRQLPSASPVYESAPVYQVAVETQDQQKSNVFMGISQNFLLPLSG